ncbi:MAG: transcription factor S [Nanoarchaeota archaeon]|nr:transcription factor S [Nanoarchaeota archaeon]
MMFCPKCGTILKPKKDKNKKVLHCSCGFNTKDIEGARIQETVRKEKDIEVVPDDEKTLPIADDVQCEKCKNKKAYYWLVQTRAGDEPETKFLRCTKCKHTWRDYS